MKTSFRFIILSVFVLCLGISTFAQTSTTGVIEGTVVDVNGAAVPNVTVTVTSPNLISPQSAQTDGAGNYRILNLPPGKYSVSVPATAGFGEFKTDVDVSLSRTTSVEVRLQPAGASGTVTVTDTSASGIDVNTNTTGTNVSSDQFSNFPTQRTVQSLYNIAPTASRSGLRDSAGRDRDPSVGGASGPENNYILDGVTTTDPAYGGSGANLPFEFVQEVEVKTGAFGAEYGKSTGGIFNVITKSGGNEFHGDVFGYLTTKGMVREVKNFSNSSASNNGFSELDAGFDIGGPIAKDKLWFFGAFNPQRRKNFFLSQSTFTPFENEVTTPFYAAKLTWAPNQNHTLTLSTFGDFTKIEGFQVAQNGSLAGSSNGFGADPNSFLGTTESGGHNYIARLNSTFNQHLTGEFTFGLHFQRFNRIPAGDFINRPANFDNLSILRADGTPAALVETGLGNIAGTGQIDYRYGGSNASLQRTFFQDGYASIFSGEEKRDRLEGAVRFQQIWENHTFKYGFEYVRNMYDINNRSTGPSTTFANPLGLPVGHGASLTADGYRVDHRFLLCTVRSTNIVCPSAAGTTRAEVLIGQNVAGVGVITNALTTGGAVPDLTIAEITSNPFLIRNQTRIRDFKIIADTKTNTESFYIQDDYKLRPNITLLGGVRWDYQQAYGKPGEGEPLKLNNFIHNLQPRLGFIWDFTGTGKGKVFANYARYVETPIPLDINVRALSDTAQTDNNLRIDRYFPTGANVTTGLSGAATLGGPTVAIAAQNLGHSHTPPDPRLKPQTLNDFTGGIEFEVANDLVLGARGIYRAQDNVIEDGSFDDGDTYFLFNPGDNRPDSTEEKACLGDPVTGRAPQCFGYARRYYRALEVTATKRFSNNYQFLASYVFSSLTGNYEGLFRNDNGQSDPNITSLFDLTSLLANTYGRLPNDKPHQFKFDGSYRWKFGLLTSASFRAQSGRPFDALIGHPIYGANEGFAVPRGTAIVPADAPGGIKAGSNRSPTTYQLDLGGYYPIKFSESRQLRFTADWFNVLNAQRSVIQDNTFTLPSGAAGVPDIPNVFYGQGTIFQYPSTLRLGVKFQF
jgi:outer membrane receptor protein involved in Fe transport